MRGEDKIELSDKMKEFLRVIEVVQPARFLNSLLLWSGLGRPMIDRENIIRAQVRLFLPVCRTECIVG